MTKIYLNVKCVYFVVCLLFSTSFAFGQFTSVINGNWNDGATWGKVSPGTAGIDYPSSTTQDATIATNVTVPASYAATVRALYIRAGFTVTIANTGSVALNGLLTIEDDGLGGNGILAIYGTLTANEGSSFLNDSPVTTTVFSTGKYTHNFTASAGNLLQATWNSGSTCEVIGYTTNVTAPGFLGQSFHHFTWNCPTGGGATNSFISFAGSLTTVGGNFTVSATGGNTRTLRLFDASASKTMTVGGNVVLDGSSRLVLATTGTGNSLTVTGNFTISNNAASQHTFSTTGTSNTLTVSGNFLVNATAATTIAMATGAGGTSTMNITGNLTVSPTVGAILNMGSTATSIGAINLKGNFINSNVNTTVSSAATAGSTLTFNGNAAQTFSNSGIMSTKINYSVNTGSILDIQNSALVGTGSFTLSAGATLKVGSPDGLVTGTSLGNVRVSGARSYVANSNIIYNGTVAQNLGDEWSAAGALNGVTVNLELANTNAAGVTNNIVGSTNLVGTLTLTSNPLNIGNSNTIVIQNNFVSNGGTIGGSNTSNLTFSGSGTMGTLTFAPGAQSLNNLTVGRTGTLVLGSNLTITGASSTINLSFGNLNFTGRTLTMDGSSISSSGTGLICTSATNSNLIFSGPSFSGSIPFSGAGNIIDNVTFSVPTGTFTWNSNVTIQTSLNLTAGALTHTSGLTMATNSTIFKGSGSISSSSPGAVTSYNVTYTGTGATSLELPSSATALNNLTVNSSGTITLNSGATVNGILTLSGGTFDAGANALTLKGNLVSNSSSTLTASAITFAGATAISGSITPVFGAITITGSLSPSASFQVNGNLVNNGTLNAGTATTTFGGTTTISGTQTCSFNNIIITGTLTAPSGASSINVAGTFTNNGVFNNNGSTIVFNGTSSVGGSSATNFGGVTIAVTLNAPATLNVAKNFTNNGVFNQGTGTVVFNGTATQSILGSTVTNFNNITVTNVAGPPAVTVQSNQNLLGVLTLSANSQFDADGPGTIVFTLVSSNDGAVYNNTTTADASIATLPSGAAVTGNVTVQRYMAIEGGNTNRIYRYISSAVQNAPVSQIQATIPVTGAFTGTSACTGCSTRPSMFTYDETVAGNLNAGFTNFPVSANTEVLATGRGYTIFERGNVAPISTAGSGRWSVRGVINSGTVNFPVSFTVRNGVADDGWNLIGNPFPSTIDWNAASGWSKSADIQATIYMTDNAAGTPPNYVSLIATWNGVAGTNGGTRNIATGQGFYVKSDGPGPPSLSANENVKVAGTQTIYFRQAEPANLLRIALSQFGVRDESIIHFRADATEYFDPNADAYKLKNNTFNLSSFTQQTKVAINSLPPLQCNRIVKLDVTDVSIGTYHLDFSNLTSFDPGVKVLFHDSFIQSKWIDISAQKGYDFQVTSDTASFGGNRFQVSFGYDLPSLLEFVAVDVCSGKNPTISIKNTLPSLNYFVKVKGQTVSQVVAGNGQTLSVVVPFDKLSIGPNSVEVVAASPHCSTLTYSQSGSIKVDTIYNIKNAKGGLSCRQGSVTLSASGAPTDGKYNWYESQGDQTPLFTGASFETPVLQKTKTYYVSAVNSLGCEGQRAPVVATVVNYDDAAITQMDEKTLQSNYVNGNRWSLDGVELADTAAVLKIKTSGVYKLTVTIGSCKTSDERVMVVTGLGEGGNGLRAYPNPVAGVYSIQIPDENNQITDLPILNTVGDQIGTMKLTSEGTWKKGQFDFGQYAAGIYYIRVVSGSEIKVLKIIKK